jgi:hypothetical protein
VVDNSFNVKTAVNAGATLLNDISTATNLYPLFADTTTGSANTIYTSNSKYLYKPSDGSLTASQVTATNGFFVNSNTVSNDYTVAANYNAHSAGPITISSGITVTVASGAVWIVL